MRTTRIKLEELADREDFNGAVELLEAEKRSRPLLPGELVALGRFIQLGTGGRLSLRDAEKAFEKALELDPRYLPALLELGWFHFAVQDDAARGLEFFRRASRLAEDLGAEALDGESQCIEELRELEIEEK